ncbi:MAG TPA: VOC family protein [Pseudonocardiaceae bacterium]|jgi:catechol 2,3-dioxygenase-like lactoylglutathione lyase family enzyme|nr:VOC family protein [Pseudonocardiaceae bacterium]
MNISVVSIPVSDQDRAKKFYLDVLGFTEINDAVMSPEMRWVHLAPPGGGASVTLVTWFDSMPAGSTRGLVLEVDDVDTWHAQLSAQGFTFPDGVHDAPWGRYISVDDPDGNGIILQRSRRQPAAS